MKKILGILIFTLISIFTLGNLVFADEISERLKTMKLITEYGGHSSDGLDLNQVDTVKIGSYPQSDITGATSEPIEWLAVKREGDKVLLISKYILEYRRGLAFNGWTGSAMQNWLNTEFYNKAFSEEEKNRISVKINENYLYLDGDDIRSADSNDLVFILSAREWKGLIEKTADSVQASALTNYAKHLRDQFILNGELCLDSPDSYFYFLRENEFAKYAYQKWGRHKFINGFCPEEFGWGIPIAGIRPSILVSITEDSTETQKSNTLINTINDTVIYTYSPVRGFTRNGVLINNEWIFYDGYYHYVYNNDGNQMLKKGWWEGRYLGKDEKMYRAQVLPDGIRYVDDNGYLVDINIDFAQSIAKRPLTPNSWYKTDAGFYYFIETDGISTKKGWYKENGVDYYFIPDNGIMTTGWWKVQYGLYDWCYFNDIHPEDPKETLTYKPDKPYGAAMGAINTPDSIDRSYSTNIRDNNLIIFNRPTPEDLDNLTIEELMKKYYSPYVNYGGTKTYSTKS